MTIIMVMVALSLWAIMVAVVCGLCAAAAMGDAVEIVSDPSDHVRAPATKENRMC